MKSSEPDITGGLYALIVYLHVSANRDLFDAIGTSELSFSQLYLLERLRGGRYSPTVRQASQLLHMTPQGGGQVVGALRRRGLVRVEADDRDYRARRMVITDRGERAITSLHGARLGEVAMFVDQLDAEEREQLDALLGRLLSRDTIAAHRPAMAAA